jgi:hypothetical protein
VPGTTIAIRLASHVVSATRTIVNATERSISFIVEHALAEWLATRDTSPTRTRNPRDIARRIGLKRYLPNVACPGCQTYTERWVSTGKCTRCDTPEEAPSPPTLSDN